VTLSATVANIILKLNEILLIAIPFDALLKNAVVVGYMISPFSNIATNNIFEHNRTKLPHHSILPANEPNKVSINHMVPAVTSERKENV